MKLPEKLIIAIFLLSVIIMANDSLMVDFRSERHIKQLIDENGRL